MNKVTYLAKITFTEEVVVNIPLSQLVADVTAGLDADTSLPRPYTVTVTRSPI